MLHFPEYFQIHDISVITNLKSRCIVQMLRVGNSIRNKWNDRPFTVNAILLDNDYIDAHANEYMYSDLIKKVWECSLLEVLVWNLVRERSVAINQREISTDLLNICNETSFPNIYNGTDLQEKAPQLYT